MYLQWQLVLIADPNKKEGNSEGPEVGGFATGLRARLVEGISSRVYVLKKQYFFL
jgi:hypothetical protein